MEMDGGKESNSRGNSTERGRREEESGLMVLSFFFFFESEMLLLLRWPRLIPVCADGSQGPLSPKLVSANWAC